MGHRTDQRRYPEGTRIVMVNLRMSAEERETIKAAARHAKLSINVWARRALLNAAEREMKS